MEAPSSIVCEACRVRWFRYPDKQGRAITHTPVGYVKLTVDDAAQPMICRSYADMRVVIKLLADGATFRVQLIAYMAVVGEGCYTRTGPGVAIIEEAGACQGLHLALRAC